MREGETEREMTRRHVAEGRVRVERQLRILDELRTNHHPVELAEQLLAELEHAQALHEAHLSRIEAESDL